MKLQTFSAIAFILASSASYASHESKRISSHSETKPAKKSRSNPVHFTYKNIQWTAPARLGKLTMNEGVFLWILEQFNSKENTPISLPGLTTQDLLQIRGRTFYPIAGRHYTELNLLHALTLQCSLDQCADKFGSILDQHVDLYFQPDNDGKISVDYLEENNPELDFSALRDFLNLKPPFYSLPNDILMYVQSYLSEEDLNQFRQACRKLFQHSPLLYLDDFSSYSLDALKEAVRKRYESDAALRSTTTIYFKRNSWNPSRPTIPADEQKVLYLFQTFPFLKKLNLGTSLGLTHLLEHAPVTLEEIPGEFEVERLTIPLSRFRHLKKLKIVLAKKGDTPGNPHAESQLKAIDSLELPESLEELTLFYWLNPGRNQLYDCLKPFLSKNLPRLLSLKSLSLDGYALSTPDNQMPDPDQLPDPPRDFFNHFLVQLPSLTQLKVSPTKWPVDCSVFQKLKLKKAVLGALSSSQCLTNLFRSPIEKIEYEGNVSTGRLLMLLQNENRNTAVKQIVSEMIGPENALDYKQLFPSLEEFRISSYSGLLSFTSKNRQKIISNNYRRITLTGYIGNKIQEVFSFLNSGVITPTTEVLEIQYLSSTYPEMRQLIVSLAEARRDRPLTIYLGISSQEDLETLQVGIPPTRVLLRRGHL